MTRNLKMVLEAPGLSLTTKVLIKNNKSCDRFHSLEDGMPLVNIAIHGRNYEMHCGEGQEPHLKALADKLSSQVTALAQANPAADEARLLVMAGLLLSDEYLAEKAAMNNQSAPCRCACGD